MKKIRYILLLFFPFATVVKAQEVSNEYQGRTSISVQKKWDNNFKLSLTPEIRFDDNFNSEEFIFEGKGEYEAKKWIEFEALYRLRTDLDKSDTKISNQYSVGTTLKTDVARLTPSVRIRYSNYADDSESDKSYLRYRVAAKYDIGKSKVTPKIGVELFHSLSEKNLHKTRYSLGIGYKFNKQNQVGIGYKYDYFNQKYKNRHIVSINYTYKLKK